MILDRDIWVDRTLTTLAEPQSEGSFLLARKGGFMRDERAKALGIIGEDANAPEAGVIPAMVASQPPITTKPMTTTKQVKKPENKAIRSSENKMIRSSENKTIDSPGDELMIDLETFDDLE